MATLTLNQAAKTAKKAKATLLEAIKNGRMSAPKDELGRYRIDPAELFRVYPPDQSETGRDYRERPQEETSETGALRATVNHMRELIRQIESERDDLRERLNQSEEERRSTQAKLTAVLTDQSTATAAKTESGFWKRLFRNG